MVYRIFVEKKVNLQAKKVAEDFAKMMGLKIIEDNQPTLIPINDDESPF